MPGERCFYAHGDGFLVARLAHHDDVRVGPKESPHDEGEVNAGFFVHLNLAQALLGDLHRVLDRPDFGVGLVKVFQDGMQRGRFAGAGGAAHVKQAVRFGDGGLNPLFVVRCQAQLVHGNRFAPGQNPHHHVFHAAGGRDGGDPKLDVQRAVFSELDLAVLWLATL